MKIDLTNKTALICASSKGIGLSCAENIAKSGGRVIINSRNEENLLEAKDKIIESCKTLDIQPEIKLLKGDLENIDQLPELVKNLLNEFSIDILILNSGGPKPGGFLDYENPIEFNQDANKIIEPSIVLMNYLLPSMIKNNFGRIINISSIGLLKPITTLAVSNSSRSYLAGLMAGMVGEVSSFGITLNTICPGIIWTERQLSLSESESARTGLALEEVNQAKIDSIPLGKFGSPDDIGALIAFLCSSYGDYITGQTISVDGGLLGLSQ